MNIILCGFMGSGKTTIAKSLAKRLNKEFIDLDEYITKKTGMKVSVIFEKYGEKGFRKYENQAVFELIAQDNLIIATGGGTILDQTNTKLLKKSGRIFFLDVSVETVIKRLQNDTTRPLLNRTDKVEAIADLLASRLPIYKQAADYIVDANSSNIEQKVMKIIEIIYKNKLI